MDETEQLQAALNYCLQFSEEMLIKAGEFYPFGAVITSDGSLSALGFDDGGEHPSPGELYAFAEQALTRSASSGEILVGALAVNVDIPREFEPPFPDGVRVKLESRGFSRLVYCPYRIVSTGVLRKKRNVEFGEMFAVEAPHVFFPGAP
jgi:hypothetical protein